MIVCVSNEKRACGRVFLWPEITAGFHTHNIFRLREQVMHSIPV